MSIFKRIFNKKPTASVAKERLQIIVAHERTRQLAEQHDFIPQLQQELVAVIRKYIDIDDDQVNIELEKEGNCSVLELNVTLPETA